MPETTLELMWTALPRGVDPSTSPAQARVSVLVTPRVTVPDPTAAATLADVPDLIDWPAQLAGLRFSVEVDPGTGSATPLPTTVVSGAANPALWRALLPPATPVASRVFDQDRVSSLPVNTYNKSIVLRQLQGGYATVYRASPVALPPRPRGRTTS